MRYDTWGQFRKQYTMQRTVANRYPSFLADQMQTPEIMIIREAWMIETVWAYSLAARPLSYRVSWVFWPFRCGQARHESQICFNWPKSMLFAKGVFQLCVCSNFCPRRLSWVDFTREDWISNAFSKAHCVYTGQRCFRYYACSVNPFSKILPLLWQRFPGQKTPWSKVKMSAVHCTNRTGGSFVTRTIL